MVQANAEVAQDLPLQPGLAVRNVLRLEVGDLRTEDCPDAQILGWKTRIQGRDVISRSTEPPRTS